MVSTRILSSLKVPPLSLLNRVLKGKAFEHARYFILLDENTMEQCLPYFVSSVAALQEAAFFEVPVGEECKQIEIASQLWQSLLESGADRNSVIVNLGGGCVCDLGGFVAAGYKRGIRYINVPTTLLAMVDASVGGKTAVNVAESKNQVGFFHQPVLTCLDPCFLPTLSEADVKNGLFELKKTMFVSGASDALFLDSGLNFDTVLQAARFKAAVCKADPYDHSVRKMLNFGHTFGHAIESFSHHERHAVPHGVAVGLGMWCALYLSVMKLALPESVLNSYSQWLTSLVTVPNYTLKDTETMLEYMRQDKKNEAGEIRCVLLKEVGVPVVDVSVDDNEVRDALLRLSRLSTTDYSK